MDGALLHRFDKLLILGLVGEYFRLELIVVKGDYDLALGGNETLPEIVILREVLPLCYSYYYEVRTISSPVN
jgi:hypothetical protein